MRNLLKRNGAAFAVLLLSGNNAYALDPLLSEQNVPEHSYSVYSETGKDDFKINCEIDINNLGEVNMADAINIALCQNPKTKMSWLAVKQQSANLGKARSSYLPTVNLSGSIGESDHNGSEVETTIGMASVDWLLFDFGKREADIDTEYYSLMQSNYTHNSLIQDTMYSVIENYCNYYSSAEKVKSNMNFEKSYKMSYEIAEEKFELGLVPKADLLKAKTAYSQSVLTRQKSENEFFDYQGRFLSVLNIKQGTQLDLQKPVLIKSSYLIDENMDDLISTALKNNPEVKALIQKEKSYRAADNAADLSWAPNISAFASTSISEYDNQLADDTNDTIGLKVSFSLFNGFSNYYGSKKSMYAYDSIKEEKESIKNDIAYQVWSSYYTLQTANKNLEVATDLTASASESKDVTLGMYKNGKSDMLDVLQTEASYQEAEIEKIVAEYDKIIAEAYLLKSLGVLNNDIINKKEEGKNEIK